MKKLTKEWATKAEADFVVANELRQVKPPVYDARCFHCQQTAEKYLKAILVELGVPVPRTHNLDDLLGLLLPQHPVLRALRRGIIFLTDFAVETRYPGENATKRQAEAALRWAGRVRATVRPLLGLSLASSGRKR